MDRSRIGILARRVLFATGLMLVVAGFAGFFNAESLFVPLMIVNAGGYLIAVAVIRQPTNRQ